MSLRQLLLAALALPLALAPAIAQQPPTRPSPILPMPAAGAPLTLGAAEELLVQRNLALLAARRGIDLARAQRLVASAFPSPTVGIATTAGQFNETTSGRVVGVRGVGPTNDLGLSLTAVIERGGKRELRTRAAEAGIGVAEAQLLDTLRTQVFTLRQAYLNALLARANLDVALANRASLDRTEALLRRQSEAGAIPEGDLIRFQAGRLQFETDVVNGGQLFAAAVAQVAAILAADPAAATFRPDFGRAGRGPGLPGPVAYDLRGSLAAPGALGLTREQLLAGVDSRPDVVAALRGAEQARGNTAVAEAGRFRDVTVGLGGNRTRLNQNFPDSSQQLRANDTFGLNFSVPIFTSRLVEGNIQAAQAQQGQAELNAEAARLQARADFAAAWAGLEAARALSASFADAALRRAEEAYQITERAYLAGGRSLVEVLDALRTLNATRVAVNQARAGLLLALANLEQASGVQGVFPRP
mgnify:CR=1 FL=1